MSFRKALAPLVLLALVPLAHAQALDDVTLAVGALGGLVRDDDQDVVAYRGNATVAVTVRVGCAAILDAMGDSTAPVEQVEVVAVNPPPWLVAAPHAIPLEPSACVTGAAANNGYVTVTGEYPFSVAAEAPGVVTQVMNLTARLEGGVTSAPAQVLFAVQFHSDYEVIPSIQFPHTVTGKSANFTVAIANRANARGMVMVEELHTSAGTFGGLASTEYDPPQTKTFNVQFRAPEKCWTTAQVEFKTFGHFLLLDQRAGTYKDERTHVWEFTNGNTCTPGEETQDAPLGGWVLVTALLGAALATRRRF